MFEYVRIVCYKLRIGLSKRHEHGMASFTTDCLNSEEQLKDIESMFHF